MSSPKPSYSDIVLSCLDQALNIVGESGRKVVYEALANRYGVSRSEVADHPEQFIKILKIYLGSASEAVEKEALYWIKQESGIDAENLTGAIDAVKREYVPQKAGSPQQQAVSMAPQWQLESQSSAPDVNDKGESQLFQYSARFSYGPPPQQKQVDSQSREALEAYLREIVDRHSQEKKKEREA